MRVRKVMPATLSGRNVIVASFGRIGRGPDDEGFQCPGCTLVLVVPRQVVEDGNAAFRCPYCDEHCARAN